MIGVGYVADDVGVADDCVAFVVVVVDIGVGVYTVDIVIVFVDRYDVVAAVVVVVVVCVVCLFCCLVVLQCFMYVSATLLINIAVCCVVNIVFFCH